MTAAAIIFVVGLVLLYKKGAWLGVPISVLGILLVLIAILGRLFLS